MDVARYVSFADGLLSVELRDGRIISVPLDWYPRLVNGTSEELANWQLLAGGIGIHWPDLDEDISVAALLAGRRSGEIEASLQWWLSKRRPAVEIDELTGIRTVRIGRVITAEEVRRFLEDDE
jgi:Protein of unknown function (DUF2442)